MNWVKRQFQTTRLIQLLIQRKLNSLIEDLQIRINQQQFTPLQIEVLKTNLTQYSAFSLGKANNSLRKVFTELKTIMAPIEEKIDHVRSQQNVVIRNERVFTVDFQK